MTPTKRAKNNTSPKAFTGRIAALGKSVLNCSLGAFWLNGWLKR